MLCVYTSCICPTRMRDWVYNVHSISVGMHFLTEQLLYMKTCLVCLCVWCVYHFWLLSSCASWVLAPRNSTICPLCLYTAILLCKLSLGRHGLVLLGSFPGSPTPEHEHWSYAGGENKRQGLCTAQQHAECRQRSTIFITSWRFFQWRQKFRCASAFWLDVALERYN